MDVPRRSAAAFERVPVVVHPYVLSAFLLQVVGYAALVSFLDHGDVTPLVGSFQTLPPLAVPLLAVLAVLALPAVVAAIALVAPLELALGRSVHPPTTGLVTAGDSVVIVVAYLLPVVIVWAYRRRSEERGRLR